MSASNSDYLAQIIPILPVKDVLEALEFYIKKLGFELVFIDEERQPRYAGIRHNNIALHLQRHEASEWEQDKNRPMLRIQVQGIESLYKKYQLMGVFHNHTSLEEKPWGTLEFAFYDPFKNGLIFYAEA